MDDRIREQVHQRAARMRAPQPPQAYGYPLGATNGMLSSGSGEAPQQPRMVSVSAATRISIGCQTFYFSRDEYGYSVSTREYQDWRLSNEDFEALVAALADLLPPLEAVDGSMETEEQREGLRRAVARGYCCAHEKSNVDSAIVEVISREIELFMRGGAGGLMGRKT